MGDTFLTSFVGTFGVLVAIGVIVGIGMLIKRATEKKEAREKKAKTVLEDRDIYLKKQMFEELSYIEKYKKELQQGEWPREMDEKFEYNEPKSKDFIFEISADGFIFKRRKRFLKLKECFRKKQQPKDDTKEVKKKDNDNDKQ